MVKNTLVKKYEFTQFQPPFLKYENIVFVAIS